MTKKRCPECGIGTIRPLAKSGRRDRYKGMELEYPSTLEIPTCDNCEAEWMDARSAEAADAALEPLYREALRLRMLDLLQQIAAEAPSMRQVEQALGVSEGYLSKLKNGRSAPSGEIVASLSLLARDVPGGLAQLGRLWNAQPAALFLAPDHRKAG